MLVVTTAAKKNIVVKKKTAAKKNIGVKKVYRLLSNFEEMTQLPLLVVEETLLVSVKKEVKSQESVEKCST